MNKWYLYDDRLYNLSEGSNHCQVLNTSGKWFWRESIKGFSGITKFGAHIGEMSDEDIEKIRSSKVIWDEDKIQKRLRYSNSDGGSMFDSFLHRFDDWKRKHFIDVIVRSLNLR